MKTIVEVAQNLIKPYIVSEDKKYAANVAPVETSPATATHTAGTQIIYNGVLYDVTADIAVNDALATTGAGANIAAADDVSEQISNVKQALTNHWGDGGNILNKYLMANVGTDLQYATIQAKPNTTYTASTNLPINSNNNANFFAFKSDDSANTNSNGLWQGQTRTFTTNNDGEIIIGFRTVNFTNTSVDWYLNHDFQIEEGSTASAFEPYIASNQELTSVLYDKVEVLANEVTTRAMLGAKNFWDIDAVHTTGGNGGGSGSYSNGVITFTCPTVANSGGYIAQSTLRNSFTNLNGIPVILSFDVKGDSSFNATIGPENAGAETVALTTSYQHKEYFFNGAENFKTLIFYSQDDSQAHTITATNFMICLATDTDPTYQPYAMTNKELTENATPSSTSVSVPSTYSAGTSYLTFEKVNGIATLQWGGSAPTLPEQGVEYEIGTIPTGYVPRNAVLAQFVDFNSFTKGIYISLRNGKVYIYGYNTGTNGIANCAPRVTYIV